MKPYEKEGFEVKFAGLNSKNIGFIVLGVGVVGLIVLGVSLVIRKKK